MKTKHYSEFFIRIYRTKEGRKLIENLEANETVKDFVLTSTSSKTVKEIKQIQETKEDAEFRKITGHGFKDVPT